MPKITVDEDHRTPGLFSAFTMTTTLLIIANGDSPDEAIGRLVRENPQVFDIDFEILSYAQAALRDK